MSRNFNPQNASEAFLKNWNDNVTLFSSEELDKKEQAKAAIKDLLTEKDYQMYRKDHNSIINNSLNGNSSLKTFVDAFPNEFRNPQTANEQFLKKWEQNIDLFSTGTADEKTDAINQIKELLTENDYADNRANHDLRIKDSLQNNPELENLVSNNSNSFASRFGTKDNVTKDTGR